MSQRLNVADRLAHVAAQMPDAVAVACPRKFSPRHGTFVRKDSGQQYAVTTFAQLDAEATRIAEGLVAAGVRPGMRLAMLVPAGIEFVSLVFALLRSGATTVLIDPGMGRRHLLNCLAEVEPEGFVAVSMVQAVRTMLKSKFPRARLNVTVGRRWFWGGHTLNGLRRAARAPLPETHADDAAAIIFTSGSTGPPKGVLYTHRMFDTQAAEIQRAYEIQPGGVDLACFPLFGLFNSAMGVTTVFPEMDFSRPASADPTKLLTAAHDWQVTQSFASPAVWDKLSRHCAEHNESINSMRQVFSCGAPVPAKLLGRTLFCVHPKAKMHTPYGATECLPVSTIEAQEVLHETAEKTNHGAGICVGRRFPTIEWKIIRITDEPIATMDQAEQLPRGQIGELVVRGPQASPAYVTRVESNGQAKIADCDQSAIRNPQSAIPWHRMGDVGYLDDQDRFWYCGRKAHRVETSSGILYSIPVEEVFNTHPSVRRSALVAAKTSTGAAPVMVLDLADGCNEADVLRELAEMAEDSHVAQHVRHMLLKHDLPVDVRHNSKIRREDLSDWASSSLSKS